MTSSSEVSSDPYTPLLHESRTGVGASAYDDSPPPETPKNINQLLYISHFLSTWNSRVFEFGAILFVASIFPGTLLPTSVYALARAAAAILFSPMVGNYIDTANRLQVVRTSIVMQRFAVAVSCVAFRFLSQNPYISLGLRFSILGLLAFLACVEKLGAVMNLVAVERDWVVVVAANTSLELRVINSQMRRIDLFCKLVGPLAIAIIDGFSTQLAMMTTFGLSVLSVGIEYRAIARVYKEVPALHINERTSGDSESLPANTTPSSGSRSKLSWIRPAYQAFSFYYHHPVFAPSFSLAILYFTVLNFAGQMVTYLLTVGYKSSHIGLIRTLSVLFEMSATWIAPWLMTRLGPLRAAMWFSSWQVICLAIGTSFFWGASVPFIAASGLVGGVIASRVGLWGFDLSVQIIIQEGVEPHNRGRFSSIEASFQNFFELSSYASTMVFSSSEEFRYPVLMSATSVLIAGSVYAAFLRRRRGHLLHISKLICLKERPETSN